ncbi:hypothetical protein DY251_18665 [Mesorhizobium denitrificans]|uniref:Uncharacterized protein n=2 Tax=Mesorhizobium denitrificans TaxID=2294114 RepID=A0A371X6D9_9HYPH|nr:hypothetical protein DY251_18665 [Mesorhizobium denitrificans]
MAVETVRCIVKFASVSEIDPSMRECLSEGVEKRRWEIVQIMDQLASRERIAETEQLLNVARQVEQLWDNIAKRLGADDDVNARMRKAA